jgi:hypothetical protein
MSTAASSIVPRKRTTNIPALITALTLFSITACIWGSAVLTWPLADLSDMAAMGSGMI